MESIFDAIDVFVYVYALFLTDMFLSDQLLFGIECVPVPHGENL
jgi:hypothetical protein